MLELQNIIFCMKGQILYSCVHIFGQTLLKILTEIRLLAGLYYKGFPLNQVSLIENLVKIVLMIDNLVQAP